MPRYKAPIAESEFLIERVFSSRLRAGITDAAEVGSDVVHALLEEIGRIAEEALAPLNQTGDREGCRIENGVVRTPRGFRQAYDLLAEGGWIGLTAAPEHGGQGLPAWLGVALSEYLNSANMALAMYVGLSMGAYAAIERHAGEELKQICLPKLASGRWTGTMNLTEPQCGTDLGLIRTGAVPAGDGTYRISGTKIFISAGEHDLAENIVHLVLARIEGAPDGTRGISLFVVPKFLPGADGGIGARNGVQCLSVETKMGIHGNATCVMQYDDATGWLIGEENRGLAAMFTMMNEARIGVGVQGLAASEVAYQNAAGYARERLQGRALTGPAFPDQPADPLIVHPDVRRILMDIRAFNEAARALVTWTVLSASAARAGDRTAAQAAQDRLGLVTPVVKGVLTDRGFANTVLAQQLFGGHGYICETGMEQFVRDARIAMIYEGANAVQALDLVGRKLPRDGGRALVAFLAEVDRALADVDGDENVREIAQALRRARGDLEAATNWLVANALAKPDNAGAGADDYMHLFGLVALGLMWTMMASAASQGLAERDGDADFFHAKLVLARHFAQRTLPESATRLARVSAGADTVMALPAERF